MSWPTSLIEIAALIYLLLPTPPLLYLSTESTAWHNTLAFILAFTACLNINGLDYNFRTATSALPALSVDSVEAATRASTIKLAALLFYTVPTWVLAMLLLRAPSARAMSRLPIALPTSAKDTTDRAIVCDLNTPTFFGMCWVLLFVNVALVPFGLFDLLFALDENPSWAVWFGVYVGLILAMGVIGVGNVAWSLFDLTRYAREAERADMEEVMEMKEEFSVELEKALGEWEMDERTGLATVNGRSPHIDEYHGLGKGMWVDSMV